MIWFLLVVVLIAFLMGLFQVSIWIMYVVVIALTVLMLFRNPILFGKDPEKILVHLKKSKAPYMQFLFYFLQGDHSAAEQVMKKIRSKKQKQGVELMLLMERKQYRQAKELLAQMAGHKSKWYALADIAINEGDEEAFNKNKEKISDKFFLNMLEVDQAVYHDKKEVAIGLLDNMIPKLRGYKLLTAVHYRKHILEGKV